MHNLIKKMIDISLEQNEFDLIEKPPKKTHDRMIWKSGEINGMKKIFKALLMTKII